ncbi:MAG: hypothetical protein Kow00108_17320 [Calditrichia bacterium]
MKFEFTLFILGQSVNSLRAMENLNNFCKKHLINKSTIHIVDIAKEPQKASEYNIIAIPTTLVRVNNSLEKKIIGTLNNLEQLLEVFELKPQ